MPLLPPVMTTTSLDQSQSEQPVLVQLFVDHLLSQSFTQSVVPKMAQMYGSSRACEDSEVVWAPKAAHAETGTASQGFSAVFRIALDTRSIVSPSRECKDMLKILIEVGKEALIRWQVMTYSVQEP